MYQALYRKWRPQVFSDVVGQEHITSVLQHQVSSGKLSHAYMFCGSRGTGKTTCAKLLAKAANCTNLQNGNPCNECDSCKQINAGTCVDVVELDAASNNGVDNIRSLCDEVVFPPSVVKKRVYIVDEVHMLSASAFNALLKTLEEPPEHALFILATTELQKVPATIMSRCQRFDFSRIKKEKIVDRLMEICSNEGINMEREAAVIIANLSDGAMRDALSLLESCASKGGFITTEYVINLLGLSNKEQLIELIYSCAKQNTVRALTITDELHEKNGDITSCFFELLSICRDILIVKNVSSPSRFINCTETELNRLTEISEILSNDTLSYFIDELKKFINSPDSFGVNKKVSAEITVIKMTSPSAIKSFDALSDRISRLEETIKSGVVVEKNSTPVKEKIKTSKKEDPPTPEVVVEEETKEKSKPKSTSNKDVFEHVNELVKKFGEKESMKQFFLAKAKMKLQSGTLVVIADDFVIQMLNTPSCTSHILECAREFDSTIENVQFFNEKAQQSTQNSDLDTL
ncbi:MAG: DNA polymerase III subunit gamma/tau [Ruminococcaceae bacterium]|nr:DNA polymerase III subunit gamma/tau [Oscillospiraceae bacterium]